MSQTKGVTWPQISWYPLRIESVMIGKDNPPPSQGSPPFCPSRSALPFPMTLDIILAQLDTIQVNGPLNRTITQITHDSRKAGESDIFVAIRGDNVDGRKFTPNLNVAAVIADAPVEVLPSVTTIIVPDARVALAHASAALHRHPSKEMFVVGITGTNGKSTTAGIIEHIFSENDIKTGVIGTIGHRLFGKPVQTQDGRTTPEASTMQSLLRHWREQGCQAVVMEVSSIGLAWNRVDGIRYSVACFTNFSRDHLDFHSSMDEYLEAKRRLFVDLVDEESTCILNADDHACSETPTIGKAWRFSTTQTPDVYATDIQQQLDGTTCVIHTPIGSSRIQYPMIGLHNVENILCAFGVCIAKGLSLSSIRNSLRTLPAVPGRLERIDSPLPVFVDYAHSPDALAHVLKTLRPLCNGKIITVFGCGGDRDAGKRPLMGSIAEENSDICVVTSDNPRSESPQQIIDDITKGMKKQHPTFTLREEAIAYAIQQANVRTDVVLIAGKGHETYQEILGVKHPFDDRMMAKKYVPKGENHAI